MRKVLHWIHCRVWGVIVLVLGLALLPALCLGQTTVYTYTGQTLANPSWGPTTDGGTPPIPPVTTLGGSVTLSAPLAANQANQLVFPVSWSFGGITDGFLSPGLTSAETYPSLSATFVFSTVNGQITGWSWSISWNYGYDGSLTGYGTMTSIGNGGLGSDSWIGEPVSGVSHCGFAYECDTYSAYVLEPGSWSINGGPASSMAPPPDPDAAEVTSLQAQLATSSAMQQTYLNGYVGWAEDAAQYKTWLLEEIAVNASLQKQLAAQH